MHLLMDLSRLKLCYKGLRNDKKRKYGSACAACRTSLTRLCVSATARKCRKVNIKLVLG